MRTKTFTELMMGIKQINTSILL